MSLKTFLRGVHPFDGKALAKDSSIRRVEPSGEMVFPLSQHIGAPAVPTVKPGDHVLMGTADCMREAFSAAAGLGRVGGDEFAALYDRPMSEERALALGRELSERLGHIRWKNRPIEVHCSVGVCICTLPRCSYQKLYAETDRLLYLAKENGRDQCRVLRLEVPESPPEQAFGT